MNLKNVKISAKSKINICTYILPIYINHILYTYAYNIYTANTHTWNYSSVFMLQLCICLHICLNQRKRVFTPVPTGSQLYVHLSYCCFFKQATFCLALLLLPNLLLSGSECGKVARSLHNFWFFYFRVFVIFFLLSSLTDKLKCFIVAKK